MAELGFPLLVRPPALGLEMAEFCFCEATLSTVLCGSKYVGPHRGQPHLRLIRRG